MGDRVTSDLTAPILFHAVSQGALAVEIRSSDTQAREICKALTHWHTEWKCLAERACLRVLEGGCSVPVGVDSSLQVSNQGQQEGVLTLTGCVTAIDGSLHVQHTVTEEVKNKQEAEAVGMQLATILIEIGAKTILDDITKDRERRAGEAKSKEENEVTVIEGTPA